MLESIEKIANIVFLSVSTFALLKALNKQNDKDDSKKN